jgi:RNA polymerase subunit RPABC4/transcription elongation factor Spt4
MLSLLDILNIFFGILKLILAGLLGCVLVLLSPIILMIKGIWTVIENHQESNATSRLSCENCGVLMSRESFELAKVENTRREQEWQSKVVVMERERINAAKDPTATPAQKMWALVTTTPHYSGSPPQVDAICDICQTKHIYSNKDRRFEILVENQDL